MSRNSSVSSKMVRFIIMAFVLAVTGIVFAIIGAFIGGRILGSDAAGFGALGLAIGGILLGYPTGIIVGILLIKRIFHQKGSVLLGLIGGIIGTVATVALSEPLNLNSNSYLLFGAFFVLVTGLSLGGFYLKK
ncbi:hypothetical protein ACFLUS_03660 [Chloroflexota bacterium]